MTQEPLFKIKPPAKPGTPTGTTRHLPDWLRRALETQDPAMFGKHAHWTVCNKCHAVTLTGWDAYDDYAGQVTADVTVLGTTDELHALLTGRTTYELRTDPDGKKTISRRDAHRIRASPANTHRWPVLTDHACGSPLGRALQPHDMKEKPKCRNSQTKSAS
jgi:hypothetical protein